MILVVGGSPEDGLWLEDALKPTGLPIAVRPLEEALASGGAPRDGDNKDTGARMDVVVLHERRQREDLLASLERIRADPALGDVPLVVVDHERDIERFTAAVARGAAACVCPPLDPTYLRATVLRLARWRDGTDTRERRKRRRRPLLLRVDVHLPGPRTVEGLLRDVSATGCRIELAERVAPGTEISITPYGYDASLEFRLGAKVRRYVALQPGLHMLACRFVGTGAVMAPRLFALRTTAGPAKAEGRPTPP
jgi:CheY-like chemotaxis protein